VKPTLFARPLTEGAEVIEFQPFAIGVTVGIGVGVGTVVGLGTGTGELPTDPPNGTQLLTINDTVIAEVK
jgi:hypothetical protein